MPSQSLGGYISPSLSCLLNPWVATSLPPCHAFSILGWPHLSLPVMPSQSLGGHISPSLSCLLNPWVATSLPPCHAFSILGWPHLSLPVMPSQSLGGHISPSLYLHTLRYLLREITSVVYFLRGNSIKLQVLWNVIPLAGQLPLIGSKSVTVPFPERYLK